jgi:LmbE family N-acetylglucosaminyl deacetylase
MEFNFNSILAVGAHSDDVDLSCFGFLLKHSNSGSKITVLVVSPSSGDSELLEKRSDESKKSFELIPNCEVILLQENEISDKNYIYISDKIREIIIEKEIDLMLIHSEEDTHQEHRLCNKISITASRRLPINIFEFFSSSSTSEFNENLITNITNEYENKIKAINQHKTQLDKIFMSKEYLKYFNQIPEAKLLGFDYSEKFKIIKMVEK